MATLYKIQDDRLGNDTSEYTADQAVEAIRALCAENPEGTQFNPEVRGDEIVDASTGDVLMIAVE